LGSCEKGKKRFSGVKGIDKKNRKEEKSEKFGVIEGLKIWSN